MTVRMFAVLLICLLALPLATLGDEPEPKPKPVVKLEITPDDAVFEDSSWNKPIELASSDDAKKYFKGDELKALNEQVDWNKKKVLVFAWRGSGQDKFIFADLGLVNVPAQNRTAMFEYTPGRTRDLRPHTYVYALDQELSWQVDRKAG